MDIGIKNGAASTIKVINLSRLPINSKNSLKGIPSKGTLRIIWFIV